MSVLVEVESLVESLGVLRGARAVTAAAALALAGTLDGERDGSKAAAASRELRMLIDVLAPSAAGAGKDTVQRLRDELAAKRAQRQA